MADDSKRISYIWKIYTNRKILAKRKKDKVYEKARKAEKLAREKYLAAVETRKKANQIAHDARRKADEEYDSALYHAYENWVAERSGLNPPLDE